MTVARFGERLARGIERREFLFKMSKTIFGGIALWAAGSLLKPAAANAAKCSIVEDSCACSPPGNEYCYGTECAGASCRTTAGCTPEVSRYPASGGCWCTKSCCSNGSTYYYKCCDCDCGGGRICGCRRRVRSCPPPNVTVTTDPEFIADQSTDGPDTALVLAYTAIYDGSVPGTGIGNSCC